MIIIIIKVVLKVPTIHCILKVNKAANTKRAQKIWQITKLPQNKVDSKLLVDVVVFAFWKLVKKYYIMNKNYEDSWVREYENLVSTLDLIFQKCIGNYLMIVETRKDLNKKNLKNIEHKHYDLIQKPSDFFLPHLHNSTTSSQPRAFLENHGKLKYLIL